MLIFFFKQGTADEMGSSDWSSDRCASDHAKTILEMAVEKMNRGRLDDVEQAEHDEGQQLRANRVRCQPQHQQKCHDVVPDHAAVIWPAHFLATPLEIGEAPWWEHTWQNVSTSWVAYPLKQTKINNH